MVLHDCSLVIWDEAARAARAGQGTRTCTETKHKLLYVIVRCSYTSTRRTHTHTDRRERGGRETHLLLRAANSIAYFGALVGCANKK